MVGSGYFSDNTMNTAEYSIPTGACMDKNGLPTMLFNSGIENKSYGGNVILGISNTNIPDYKNNYFLNVVNVWENSNTWIHKYHTQMEIYDPTKHSLDSYTDEIKSLLPVMQYSTDGGRTYHRYFHRDQEGLPTGDCEITNFKIEQEYGPLYTYTIKVNEDYTGSTLKNDIKITYNHFDPTNNTSELRTEIVSETLINDKPAIFSDLGTAEICTEGNIHIRITEKPKPTPQPEPEPKPEVPPSAPVVPSTSGPGGYVPGIEPVKTIDPPKIGNFTEDKKPEPEKSKFTMSFTDIKEKVEVTLPKKLPKMGATTSKTLKRLGLDRLLVETRFDNNLLRLAGSDNTDLSHWLQVVGDEDKNRDSYIVIPSNGLVVPVSGVNKEDLSYSRFLSGNTEDFFTYANNGGVELPNFSEYGESGNKVIGGHSSFWRNSQARYKTHFQKIIGLETGKEVWVYKKNNETGKYDRYVYVTESSYNTTPEDTSILADNEESILTLFTCTPIGGDEGRWVVKAKFFGKY